MRWLRIASAFPRWTTALLAGFIALQYLCWWAWFAWELRPLERYYLVVYFHSAEDAKHPGIKTRIQPLFKTAPGKKRELVVASDVVSGSSGDLPVQLSQSPLEQGWTAIEKGAPIQDDSVAVEDLLRDDFYQSQAFWQLVAEPLLYSCTFLLASITLAFFIRKELTEEWKGIWTSIAESQPHRDYCIDPPVHRSRIMTWIDPRWQALKQLRKPPSKLANPTFRSGRDISAPALIDLSKGAPKPTAVRFPIPASERHTQAHSRRQERVMKHSGDSSTGPIEGRRIFPGKGDVRSLDQQPKAWDESQWID